jgi:hypothetical protein
MASNVPSSGKRQARKDHIESAVEGYKNKASKRAHLKKKLAIMDANVPKPSAPPLPPLASVAGMSFFMSFACNMSVTSKVPVPLQAAQAKAPASAAAEFVGLEALQAEMRVARALRVLAKDRGKRAKISCLTGYARSSYLCLRK